MPDLQTTIITDWKWLRTHLVLVFVAAALVGGGIYGVEALIAKHEAEKDSQWQQILAAQTAQTQLLQNKLNQDESNWSVQNAQNQQLIGTLAQTIAKRDAATKQQQQLDATLSTAQAADRLSQQTGAKTGEVVATGDLVQLNLPVSRQVVQLLDTIPALQGDLADTKSQLGAETAVATNLQANVTEQKTLIAAQQTQFTDSQNACKAQVADLKAQARKSKLKWFVAGLVAGFSLHFLIN